MSGQTGSNFQIQNLLTKTCIYCPVSSQDSKNVIHFHVRQLQMPKIAFQKSDVIAVTCFFGPLHSQKKDIALKLCMRVVRVYLDNIYSVFYVLEIINFIDIFWNKKQF